MRKLLKRISKTLALIVLSAFSCDNHINSINCEVFINHGFASCHFEVVSSNCSATATVSSTLSSCLNLAMQKGTTAMKHLAEAPVKRRKPEKYVSRWHITWRAFCEPWESSKSLISCWSCDIQDGTSSGIRECKVDEIPSSKQYLRILMVAPRHH